MSIGLGLGRGSECRLVAWRCATFSILVEKYPPAYPRVGMPFRRFWSDVGELSGHPQISGNRMDRMGGLHNPLHLVG